MARRLLDVALAALGLAVTAPLLAVAALGIVLSSPGPVLYRALRAGKDGRPFRMLKLRTMHVRPPSAAGSPITAHDDPRVFPFGAWLRRAKLDELPQLVNVLRGEMSLVGPRPERPYFVEMLRQEIPYYDLRHYVKPGITGWAQVRYRYGASIQDAYEKLQYDLYYTKHMSLRLDLEILLRTTKVVLLARGQLQRPENEDCWHRWRHRPFDRAARLARKQRSACVQRRQRGPGLRQHLGHRVRLR